MKARGFVLQASYRVETLRSGARVPVVLIYGRLEQGGSFLVRDDRCRPSFFIRAEDTARAESCGAVCAPTLKRTFDGGRVSEVSVAVPGDVPALRDRLHSRQIETFEADVRFATRYLIEHGIQGGCEIEGEAQAGSDGISWVFENPR